VDFKEIKKLVELMREMALTEIEVEETGRRIRLRREMSPPPALPGKVAHIEVQEGARSLPAEAVDATHPVRSPIVGTFYRAPSPDADPYVETGDIVKKGQTLCIVEAMKLMNEIESDVDGRVVEVCLEDGTDVEYGTVLVRIEPRP
jgi:acetyl-CoA carboxylase biotin carboxyl carrier protein